MLSSKSTIPFARQILVSGLQARFLQKQCPRISAAHVVAKKISSVPRWVILIAHAEVCGFLVQGNAT